MVHLSDNNVEFFKNSIIITYISMIGDTLESDNIPSSCPEEPYINKVAEYLNKNNNGYTVL